MNTKKGYETPQIELLVLQLEEGISVGSVLIPAGTDLDNKPIITDWNTEQIAQDGYFE